MSVEYSENTRGTSVPLGAPELLTSLSYRRPPGAPCSEQLITMIFKIFLPGSCPTLTQEAVSRCNKRATNSWHGRSRRRAPICGGL